jgi:hypothetical protein
VRDLRKIDIIPTARDASGDGKFASIFWPSGKTCTVLESRNSDVGTGNMWIFS